MSAQVFFVDRLNQDNLVFFVEGDEGRAVMKHRVVSFAARFLPRLVNVVFFESNDNLQAVVQSHAPLSNVLRPLQKVIAARCSDSEGYFPGVEAEPVFANNVHLVRRGNNYSIPVEREPSEACTVVEEEETLAAFFFVPVLGILLEERHPRSLACGAD